MTSDSPRRGSGDRWLAGEAVDGVCFAHHQTVTVTHGRFGGRRGRIALLLEVGDDPLYFVLIDGGDTGARIRQSALEDG